MEIIEKKLLKNNEIVLLVSDESSRKFNVAFLNSNKKIKEKSDLEKARFVFPFMVEKTRAMEEYKGIKSAGEYKTYSF